MDYSEFLKTKAVIDVPTGHEPGHVSEKLFDFQSALTKWAVRRGRAALWEDCGLGKALCVDHNILTTSGWKRIGDSKVGDLAYGSDGLPHKVTGVYPQGIRDFKAVTFSDGTVIKCDSDHLWTVYSQQMLYHGRPGRTITTDNIESEGIEFKGGQKKHFIPIVSPIQFEHGPKLPIDPYMLGAMLGDGCFTGNTVVITTPDSDIVEAFDFPDGCYYSKLDRRDGECDAYSLKGGEFSNSENPITKYIKSVGLHGKKADKKHIPNEYLTACESDRLSLIQGLLDTDGHASGPCVEYSTASKDLSDGFMFLVRSLGGTATLSVEESHYLKDGKRVECLLSYRSIIKLPRTMSPFRSRRKSDAHNPIQRMNPLKSIISIEPAGSGECICISVDSPDSLYITDGMTLTHNTIQQLEWARLVGGDVLIAAPLAVSEQTRNEGERFGICVNICETDSDVKPGINITNYEKIHKFDTKRFKGVVLDESSRLKNFASKTRNQLMDAFSETQYKLCCSATPAPNDYTEIGNHSEFLGIMSRTEMLAMFMAHDSANTQKWRIKGHAQNEFWKWLCQWAVMIRKPSDIGFKNNGFDLPDLTIHEHVIKCCKPDNGKLFVEEANGLTERRNARRSTIKERCSAAIDLANNSSEPWLIWCGLNDESSILAAGIPDSVEVKGSDSNEIKTDRLIGFSNGKYRVMVTKGKIAGWGMNWQHCKNMAFVGLSDSYEEYYQEVRRCWRFGQNMPVDAHIITAETEGGVVANIKRKEADANRMAEEMVRHMSDISKINIVGTSRQSTGYNPTKKMEKPKWMS